MKIGKFNSLAFKLTIWYIVILGILVALSGTFLYQGFKKGQLEDVDRKLREISNHLYRAWEPHGITWEDAIAKTEDEFKAQQPFIQVVRLARDSHSPERTYHTGRIPDDSFIFKSDLYQRAEHASWENFLRMTTKQSKLSSYDLRVGFFPGGMRSVSYMAQIGISLEQVSGALRGLTLIMILSGFLLLLLASLGGSFIIRRALSPVKTVVEIAQAITTDDLSLRIETKHRQDEIGALVETFNDMIARLDKSVKKIKQFSGDVSHELRTPLTVIRGEIEVVLRKNRDLQEYRETLDSVLEETHHMEKIIDDLLFLSRIDAMDKAKFQKDVSLQDVIVRVWDSRNSTARCKNIDVVNKKSAVGLVRGDRTLLERLLANLIDNAIRYTPEGGRVEVDVEETPQGVVLSVSDTGIGISAEHQPYIFDRFYVADPSRSKESGGAGLGLSIVKSVADLHGATIDIESEINKGTVFRIRFPSS